MSTVRESIPCTENRNEFARMGTRKSSTGAVSGPSESLLRKLSDLAWRPESGQVDSYAQAVDSHDRGIMDRSAARSATILVVDDDKAVRGLVVRILDRGGYGVIEAVDGFDALAICEREGREIDMVVTDLQMPGMSGAELIVRIREQRPQMKALLVTGSGGAEVEEAKAVMGTPVLSKPFRPVDLLASVREMIEADGRGCEASPVGARKKAGRDVGALDACVEVVAACNSAQAACLG